MTRHARALSVAITCALASASVGASADSHLARLAGPSAEARLASPDVDVRLAAAHALGDPDVGEARAASVALAERLGLERDDGVRREIFRALARRAMPEAIEALLTRPRTPAEQRDAIRALAAIDDPRALAALIERLGPDNTREPAARAIGRIGAPALAAVLHALREPAQLSGAAQALAEMRDLRALPELVRVSGLRDPRARAAAIDAIGALGDERARPTLLARLRDANPTVVAAAVRALSRAGHRDDARAVAALVDADDQRVREAALATLARLEPAMAAGVAVRALGAEDGDARQSAARVVLASRDPAMTAPLRVLLGHSETAREAASALAALDAAAGLDVLLVGAREPGPTRVAAAVGLALLVRRFEGRVDPRQLDVARHALRAATADGPFERAIVLRALARDPFVAPWIARALSSASAARRAAAATAAELLAQSSLAGDLAAALGHERDAEARRRLLCALALLVDAGVDPPTGPAAIELGDDETGPEAMRLAAASVRARAVRPPEYLARALRAGLRGRSARARASAARALAAIGDSSAWRALVAALDDDDARVRLAVARALSVIAPAEAAVDLRAAIRVESDAAVETALSDALAGATVRERRLTLDVAGPEPFDAFVDRRQDEPAPPPLELVLPDGRWLRVAVPTSGEIFVVGLPSGQLDVRFPILP